MNFNSCPKIDLHLHLDGSFRLKTIIELANKEKISLPGQDVDSYRTYINKCANAKDVNDYLKMFDLPLKLMQKKAYLKRFTKELITDLAKQNVIYAEIRFAPQLHTKLSLTQEEALLAVLEGKNEAEKENPNIKIGILTCMMSIGLPSLNWQENIETVNLCAKYLNKGVVGLDLAGAEGIVPLSSFAPLFTLAQKFNLPITCHAGDSQDSQTIKDALNFGAKRIGHGHRLSEDSELINTIVAKQIALEICPTSNIQCKTQKTYQSHPAKKLLAMGVPITLNTDNMTLADVDLAKEYNNAYNLMGFSEEDIYHCLLNSAIFSFASLEIKEELIKKILSDKKARKI